MFVVPLLCGTVIVCYQCYHVLSCVIIWYHVVLCVIMWYCYHVLSCGTVIVCYHCYHVLSCGYHVVLLLCGTVIMCYQCYHVDGKSRMADIHHNNTR